MKQILRRAWAEVHLGKAADNFKLLASLLDKNTAPVCVIKADAYGHGDIAMMRLYQDLGVRHFAVSNLNEAVRLRENGCKGDIIILSWSPPDSGVAAALSEYDIIQTVVSPEHAKALSDNALSPVRIHIKLDTGMGRVGLNAMEPETCADEAAAMCSLKNLNAEGIFTHFAVADGFEPDKIQYTNRQKELFFAVVDEVERRGFRFAHRHFTNSAGALIHRDERSTLARLGITLYGLTPDENLPLPDGLKPVMDLNAVISQVKTLREGQSVGYGRTYIVKRDIQAATIPVGYADGYPRLLSDKAHVLIRSEKAPVIGRICMDQFMVDASGISNVKAGETVTLIGADGDNIITANDLAEIIGTIGYEIVCGISARVPRIYKEV